ncbi:hypothetical protein VNO80_03101 [Phaseolus coccineus]|uniref:Uncharacterized protein n=1 Tax=Phaseolus coccineus TaxID=3886 RepID=A0AAN9RNC1_PHACN
MEMKEITSKNFHEFTRKEQELQKLRRQISELESFIRQTAKSPPSVDFYDPFQISPQKLMMSAITQQPVKPPFPPPRIPEATTFFGKKEKEPIDTAVQTSSSGKQEIPEKPPSQLMVSLKEDVPVFQEPKEESVPELLEFESEENSGEEYSEEDSEEGYADLSVLMVSHNRDPDALHSGFSRSIDGVGDGNQTSSKLQAS